jgi:hypothetical protein
MHPSFGVPWPRLQRAAARLTELHASAGQGRVHALLFLCGLKYLLTYREANGRRLSHYLDDGLREGVDYSLPALMKHCTELKPRRLPVSRARRAEVNIEFQQLRFAFHRLNRRFPAFTERWIARGRREANIVRLTFGMGVSARFAPESHLFVRRMLEQPMVLLNSELDVLESFRWDPEWSLMLAR